MSDMHTKPKPTFAPVYAAIYPGLAEIAQKHGYALAIHGSLQRDFDLVAVPWVESPSDPQQVVDEITATFSIRWTGNIGDKPHGRRAWTLSVEFGQCAIDLSFMPTKKAGGE